MHERINMYAWVPKKAARALQTGRVSWCCHLAKAPVLHTAKGTRTCEACLHGGR
jgi:hypothetical protein